jgi:putative acetyltransferase
MIRIVRPADHAAIATVTDAAFGGPAESLIVRRLREDGDILFELVELDGEEITGHVAFSRLWADSVQLFAALAPLSIRPDRQNQGGGGRLTRAGLDLAKEFGAHGVMVLGHPTYYPRFGFSREAAAKVASPYSRSPAFLALALEPGALDQPLTVAYPDAFKD